MDQEFVNTRGTYPTLYLIVYAITWVLLFLGTLSYALYLDRGTDYSIEGGILVGTLVFAWVAVLGTLLMKGVTPVSIRVTDTGVIGMYPPKPSQGLDKREWVMPFERVYKVNVSWLGCYVSARRGPEYDMKKPFPREGAGGYMPLNLENARHVKTAWEAWTKTNVISVKEEYGRRIIVQRRDSSVHLEKERPPSM